MIVHACFSGACPWEKWNGDCRKPRSIPCPMDIPEGDEEAQVEYEDAVLDWEEHRG